MGFAIEATVHFFFEKQTEPYKWYGEGSIAEEKCAVVQEASGSHAPHESRLAGANAMLAVDITKVSIETLNF